MADNTPMQDAELKIIRETDNSAPKTTSRSN